MVVSEGGSWAAPAGRCGFWYVPDATTTRRLQILPTDVSTRNVPSSLPSSVDTLTPSRTGARKLHAYRSMWAAISSRTINPSGSSPSYSPPGSRTVQLGMTRQKLSQRPRQVCATRPRSRTTCSTPAWLSSWLSESPACPPPTTTTSTTSATCRIVPAVRWRIAGPASCPRPSSGRPATSSNSPRSTCPVGAITAVVPAVGACLGMPPWPSAGRRGGAPRRASLALGTE